ncbi:MAG: NAD(P)/FAD-dependent oxidoreductase [Burkholderiales bacterium]|nr:NAD(P)/FAD-dependent oxidoreductase [Burkholderiales bacterium]MBK8666304.1 NAD(P)/FAD-dependent oxidoreductase [Burkholderiales bacterium]
MSAEHVDTVVIGAGVVGLAVARALALAGREVMVLEALEAFGTQTSARNSEVIHAGIYYPQDSLKARLCVRGRQMLYDYCAERGVPHRRCGKLIVATSESQIDELRAIRQRAAANGVGDLPWLTRAQAQALEPALQCHAALLSPSTGIVDSHGLMLSLLGDLENAGGLLALQSPVESMAVVAHAPATIEIVMGGGAAGTKLAARWVVNAAGLQAPALAARTNGLDARHVPRAWFAKGNYFTLSGRAPFGRLIYPVPEPGGLGVHLTLDLGGQAKFGPDVQWVDASEDLQVDPARGDAFYAEVRRYWPGLPDDALQPGYAGIRPKISGPGEAAADFLIQGPRDHGVGGLVNLFGIESPGLTSCLALAEQVVALVGRP